MTINGKTMETIEQQLKEPFKESEFKQFDNYYYLPADAYIQRFNEVVGNKNYDFIPLAPLDVRQIGDRYCLSFTGTLIIRDDEGSVIKQIPGTGGLEVARSKKGGIINYNNQVQRVQKNALVSAIRHFDPGTEQLKAIRKAKKRNGDTSNSISQSQEQEVFSVYFKQKITSLKREGYKTVVDALTMDQESLKDIELVIFREGIASIRSRYNLQNFINAAEPGRQCYINGFLNEFRGKKQIVMLDLLNKEDVEEKV